MTHNTSLSNHFLIAMPSLHNSGFEHSLIYICEHHIEGAVGLMINRPLSISLNTVFEQMNITQFSAKRAHDPVLLGGPVQTERGFVLHRPSGQWRSSLFLEDSVTVTTSNDIIRAISIDEGPADSVVTLGYSSWQKNQLEEELLANKWLVCPYRAELLYEVPFHKRWEYAGLSIGVKMGQLSGIAGHA
tara:strand:- start:7086 stop:7649 length:564 start_codon:yes stop_codon:yes gene_type:complete